jgi:hypothetical protein
MTFWVRLSLKKAEANELQQNMNNVPEKLYI